MNTSAGHHGHHDNTIEARLARLEAGQERVEASVGRIEESVGLQQAAWERIEKLIMGEADQIAGVDAKINTITNGWAAVIDSAVARIVTEIQKQGQITPEVQATLDHLSATADGLEALRVQSVDRIAAAGTPPVVPPSGPIPEPPVVPTDGGAGGGTDTGGGAPLSSRRG